MTDIEEKGGVPGNPDPAGAEAGPGANHEDDIARLLRLAGPRPDADPERTERVRTAVHLRWRAEVRSRRRLRFIPWISIPVAIAAILIAMVGVAQWLARARPGVGREPVAVLERVQVPLYLGDGGDATAGAKLRPGAVISSGAGGRATLQISSGVSVRLDSDSALRLVSTTVLDLERGAVYVDSGGAKGASVAVRTPAGVVRDVGTQFEVRLVEDGLHVTVREGVASLGRSDGDLEIPAGTRLTADAHGQISRTMVAPHGPDWDWVLEIAPPIHLEGQTLGAFLAWVSRETGWQVRFADPSSAKERASIVLHGSVDGLRPDEAPAAVLPTCGLTSHLEGNVLVIGSLDASEGSP